MDDISGDGGRIKDLNAARPGGYVLKTVNITPDEARAMIDGVLRRYGLDPAEITDPNGWRRLVLGRARGFAGVMEWKTGEPYLVVFAPLLELPAELQLSDLYRAMLELNHADTLSARFSLDRDTLFVSLVRPIRGLDGDEVDEALRAVMAVADHAESWLNAVLEQYLGQATLPADQLPEVRLTPEETRKMSALLAACDLQVRRAVCSLLEKWVKAGYSFDLGVGSLGLKIPIGPRTYTLAAVRPDLCSPSALVILGWEGLRRMPAFPAALVDRFQGDVQSLGPLKATESTAHLEIGAGFEPGLVQKLFQALDRLAKSVQHDQVQAPRPVTPPNIAATLALCDEHTQQIFSRLLTGWEQAGGVVQCQQPGRISLKLRVKPPSNETPVTRVFDLAKLVASKAKRGPAIEAVFGLASGDYPYLYWIPEPVSAFEKTTSLLPGYEHRGTIHRILLGEAFSMQHAEELLASMLAVKSAVQTEGC